MVIIYSGAVAGGYYIQWRLRPVGKLPMLSEIVGKLSRLSEIVKVVDGGGGGGGEDLKCCRPEKFLVCRKKISVWRKSTALAPPPPKHGSHGATDYIWASRKNSFELIKLSNINIVLVQVSSCSNTGRITDGLTEPLELIELSSVNKVSLV